MEPERGRDAHAHARVPAGRAACEARHVAAGVAAGREEVRHHDDLARTARDARVDRVGDARRHEREVRDGDVASRQPPRKGPGDASELRVRGGLAAAVVDEHHGASAHSGLHQ